MDLSSLLNGLSEADLSRLRETAASVFGAPPAASAPSPVPAPAAVGSDLLAAAGGLARMMSASDKRSDLLLALKPFLSEARKQKAEQAAMMLRLLAIVDQMRGGRNG